MEILNILVIDDSEANLKAATEQLAGHNVVTESSFSSARHQLDPEASYKRFKGKFDAVLVDLLMPMDVVNAGNGSTFSGTYMGDKGLAFVGQELPLGIFLVLYAAKVGVKNIALLTDADHHDHPASACLDMFQGKPMVIGDAKVLLTNNHGWVKTTFGQDGKEVSRTKMWDKLLEHLLSC